MTIRIIGIAVIALLLAGCSEDSPGILEIKRDSVDGTAINVKAFNNTNGQIGSLKCEFEGSNQGTRLGIIDVRFDSLLESGQDSVRPVDFKVSSPNATQVKFDCTYRVLELMRISGVL